MCWAHVHSVALEERPQTCTFERLRKSVLYLIMLLSKSLLDNLSVEAAHSDRLRKNICLHHSPEDPAQVMINHFEPATQIDIHRHFYTDETLVVLRGKLRIVYYNDKKDITGSFILENNTENFGINIPKGQWHWLDITEPVTVIEVKDGPYRPLDKNEIL